MVKNKEGVFIMNDYDRQDLIKQRAGQDTFQSALAKCSLFYGGDDTFSTPCIYIKEQERLLHASFSATA